MNISENIKWITDDFTMWKYYTNRSYRAKIQIADSQQVYNIPDKPGVVYNYLEDAYEKVEDAGYVITGIAGEMWPIGEKALKKYNVESENISSVPIEVETIELDTVYAAIMISKEEEFTLEVDYGKKAILHGNRPSIDHGDGDYILVRTKQENGKWLPDFDDNGRIINGAIFDKLYKQYRSEKSF